MKKRKTTKRKLRELYIIAGPNGAGKTTFAREFLPHFVRCLEFVNADYIATGISPFAPAAAAIEAGRVMLKRIDTLAAEGKSFGFETTLAGRGYVKLLQRLKAEGYRIHLFFVWLPSSSLALERVAQRVRKGGHDIPASVIRRRFDAGLKNFFEIYRPLVDRWELWDGSSNPPQRIASSSDRKLRIDLESLYNKVLASRIRK